ncbi:hypothetical protein HYU21_01520 [Candidatus Woesearchaeota archaeon]|nr:hypothetical protein [Candidatus Woesearchaeota archaeon]
MGWLFGTKKKVPKVPFPRGEALEEGEFKFPSVISSDKVIEPEKLKQAAGIGEAFPDIPAVRKPVRDIFEEHLPEPVLPKSKMSLPKSPAIVGSSLPSLDSASENEKPLYVKIEVYKRLLGEVEGLKKSIECLEQANEELQNSRYNEETDFTKLKRSIRGIHDRLLQVDKSIFKSSGE